MHSPLPEPSVDPALCTRTGLLRSLSHQWLGHSNVSHWLLLLSIIVNHSRKPGAEPSRTVCINGHTKRSLGTCLRECPHSKQACRPAPNLCVCPQTRAARLCPTPASWDIFYLMQEMQVKYALSLEPLYLPLNCSSGLVLKVLTNLLKACRILV